MKLLVDTHAALWSLAQDARLSQAAERALRDADHNEVLLSAAVVWEVAIKRALGKLDAPSDFRERWLHAGAHGLPIDLVHAAHVTHLPFHHRDPFDRLLVAQALLEDARIVSHDPAFAAYGVPLVW
jgi:PIN domain nuclease of toxin-antitoxin system